MIRLHMLNNDVVNGSAIQLTVYIFAPLFHSSCIYGIHQGYFFIQDQI